MAVRPTVEDRLGHGRYLAFYLACGVLASFAHADVQSDLDRSGVWAPRARSPAYSAAIMRLFPLARIIVLVPILFIPLFFEVPAVVFAGLWFLIQLFQGTAELLMPSSGGGVAWWAHIGGFVAGSAARSAVAAAPSGDTGTYYLDEGVLGFQPPGRP